MSTVNVRPSRDAAASVNYVLYGNSTKLRVRLVADGATRAAAFRLSVAAGDVTPAAFVARAEHLTETHGRKNMLYSYVLAFHPDEFDVSASGDMERIADVAMELAERMHSADYMVVVHADSLGGHGHAHILISNHDNLTGKSLQRYTSWKHGLRQLNDELMRDEGLLVLPDPEEPKAEWELRREEFASDGFEQVLGDKVYAALADPRSVNRESFEEVLAEYDITLAVTDRDGWSYKMRRLDNGKYGRKKASGLTPEFTAVGAQRVFEYHAKRGQAHGAAGHDQGAGRTATEFGDVGALDLDASRRRAATHEAHEISRGSDDVREDHGRAAGQEARESVDLAAARTALELAARRRDEEQAERDREDARNHREAVEHERSGEAARGKLRAQVRPGRARDGLEDRETVADDDFGLE
ncbi:relaxase/mobilization nuclease domain-containing protein [Leifsonia sp. NPDC058248]|uniref:relaxase/mobilization nuclease domain-containing protein n=1 Tax=Leifsonia sp. NPDC058248 TaxID=3346402 RepID=UPI0036DA7131